jgi:hypothetical protein
MKNVERKEGFHQVAVWPGTVLGDTPVEEFVKFFADEGYRVQYLEEIETAPDMKNGEEVEGTGGRNDLFFAIHDEDIPKFAVPRLMMGIRWIEDAMSRVNGYHENPIYPERVADYCGWNADA